MTTLPELFPAATIELDDLNELNTLEIGTDEYGVARFRIVLNFLMHGMQHHMAVQAQTVIEAEGEANWNDTLVKPEDAYMSAAVNLLNINRSLGMIAIDEIDQILPMITDRLKENPFTAVSEDGELVAIHIRNVFDALEAK